MSRPVRDGLFVDADPPRLVVSSCPSCGALHFPAATSCPYCGAEGSLPTELAGQGRLWAFTAVSAAPPGYLGEVPFGFGVVELDEGLRVLGRLTEADPARLSLGQAMTLCVVALGNDDDGPVSTYAFSPVEPP
jgi:uncharacterized OB-fold protein